MGWKIDNKLVQVNEVGIPLATKSEKYNEKKKKKKLKKKNR